MTVSFIFDVIWYLFFLCSFAIWFKKKKKTKNNDIRLARIYRSLVKCNPNLLTNNNLYSHSNTNWKRKTKNLNTKCALLTLNTFSAHKINTYKYLKTNHNIKKHSTSKTPHSYTWQVIHSVYILYVSNDWSASPSHTPDSVCDSDVICQKIYYHPD